ncbi:cytochrome b/b6 domain-containing protein [Burkholderia thailandensis]|uniref:cytochrome b/b6 domain-containing protein n=1 Tax=Burkholderia thailandensis TaxID=57975 RepID=UPI002D779E75|nr:cytochrome b/b6 domain-containing protein [Burkholderia thailandensis]WRS64728.1 cytochrome b/b6 domain-containing protein [Burkholderia thailandensis]
MNSTATMSASTTAVTGARAGAATGETSDASAGGAGAFAAVDAKAGAKAEATINATTNAAADVPVDTTTAAMAGAVAGALPEAMPHALINGTTHAMTQATTQATTEAASRTHTRAATPAVRPRRPIHPRWVRASHWLNAVAAVTMALSGWRIYDASPIYAGFTFPRGATLGGALQWHFAAMWLLFLNGAFYLTMCIATGRFARKFLPLTAKGVARDLRDALRGRLSHDDPSVYNAVQRAAYVAAIADLVLLVLSGLVIWKSVQFPLLRVLLGGYDNARVVHFWAMAFLVAFFVVHVAMAALVPRSLFAMLRGH